MLRKTLVVLASLLVASTVVAGPMFVNGITIPGDTGDNSEPPSTTAASASSPTCTTTLTATSGGVCPIAGRAAARCPTTRACSASRSTSIPSPARSPISRSSQTIKFTNGGRTRTMNGMAPARPTCSATPSIPKASSSIPKTGQFPGVGRVRPVALRVQPQRPTGEGVHHASQPGPAQRATPGAELRRRHRQHGRQAHQPRLRRPGHQPGRPVRLRHAAERDARRGRRQRHLQPHRQVRHRDTGQAVAQYAYKMDGSEPGSGHLGARRAQRTEFLVLERNNRGVGVGADSRPPTSTSTRST